MLRNSEWVILLHGLGRTRRSMHIIKTALQNAGYHVLNMDYPSRHQRIEVLSLKTINRALALCADYQPERIHFVTHSMGAILLRYYLSKQPIQKLGNVVMLSPPNQGSEVVDYLRNFAPFQWLNGPAGLQLGTDSQSMPMQLDSGDFPVGIITGNQSSFFDRFYKHLFEGEHDGKVSVNRARINHMRDFLVVAETHTFIMRSESVIKQIIHFLKHQQFKHEHDKS